MSLTMAMPAARSGRAAERLAETLAAGVRVAVAGPYGDLDTSVSRDDIDKTNTFNPFTFRPRDSLKILGRCSVVSGE
jgi:pyrimidine operon attenuation protein/uracil phosphoribosyltransferase